jgi:hypothetical protein
MNKLVEAAASRLSGFYSVSDDPNKIAQAAILAFLEAALEDEGVVEALRRAISESQADDDEGGWDSVYDLLDMSGNSVAIVTRQATKDALRALIQQVKS